MTAPEPAPAPRATGWRRSGGWSRRRSGSRALQRLTGLAVRLLGADAAAVSLLGDVETVVSGDGLPAGSLGRQVPLADSLCAVALADGGEPLVVPDTAARPPASPSFSPVVDGRVGGYVGVPLVVFDGSAVGCARRLPRAPRAWTDSDVGLLRQLADAVATELELVRALAGSSRRTGCGSSWPSTPPRSAASTGTSITGRLVWDDRLRGDLRLRPGRRSTRRSRPSRARLPPRRPATARMEALQDGDRQRAASSTPSSASCCPPGRPAGCRAAAGRWPTTTAPPSGCSAPATTRPRQRHGDARVARVLEAMNAAFFSLDRDWRFTYVNAEAERLLRAHAGRSCSAARSGSCSRPRSAATSRSTTAAPWRPGEERVFEAYYPAPLDAWYEVRAWPSPDGLSVYFLDVTERRAAEERARRGAARLALIADVAVGGVRRAGRAAGGEEEAAAAAGPAVVPVLGDWVIASLVGEDGRLRDVGELARATRSSAPLAARYAAAAAGRADARPPRSCEALALRPAA